MIYLHFYQTKQQHDTARATEYKEPWVAYTEATQEVTFNKSWSEKYLTFEALESGTFKLSGNSINYSIDGGNSWVSLASNTDTPTIQQGEKIMFKAELTPVSYNGVGTFSSTGTFNAMGNPYSLLFGDNFAGQVDLTGKQYALAQLFNGSKVIDASKLSLPATTLEVGCYGGVQSSMGQTLGKGMFINCSLLTKAPMLPATTLANYCYTSMFEGCTSLTKAPALPATTLAGYCYQRMFMGCTSLNKAPKLPATTLAGSCYANMFVGCTALKTAPELSAMTLATYCYYAMFSGCTALKTAPELPAMTMVGNYCYNTMFRGCTSLTTAPALPATTLGASCYGSMFFGCTSLTAAPELSATELAQNCYVNMFAGCTSLMTAPELPATALTNGCYSYMFSGCTNLNYIKAMFRTTPSTTYNNNWVLGVSETGTFVKNSAATWPNSFGTSAIPTGWTVETASS